VGLATGGLIHKGGSDASNPTSFPRYNHLFGPTLPASIVL